MRRRSKSRKWLLFTRGLMDKQLYFIITARTTCTAAARHHSENVLFFDLGREDVVKLGTAMLRAFMIPHDTAGCSICGPNPDIIVIDGQTLGCTDPDDAHPTRNQEDCPVLDIPASKFCFVQQPVLRASITKVLRSSDPVTEAKAQSIRKWAAHSLASTRRSAEASSAYIFFHFFPQGRDLGRGARDPAVATPGGADAQVPIAQELLGSPRLSSRGRKRRLTSDQTPLEAAVRQEDAGNLTLGGTGMPAKRVAHVWRDRKGLCAPNFALYSSYDDGAWLAVLPFLQAFLAETVSGMIHGHDKRAVRLISNTLRLF